MVSNRGGKALFYFMLTVLVSQNFVNSKSIEGEFADQKNYYSPDPHAGSPPRHSHRTRACPPPPSEPSGCGCGPSPPTGGGGGGSGGYYNNPPPSPTVQPISPPTPTTPSIPTPSTPLVPSPPFIPVDPNSPPYTPGGTPGTCTFWGSNPTLIWGIFGYWATIGGLFGSMTSMPLGSNLSLQEALTNPRTDGFGALYREGAASYLNSLVNKKFPFTTPEVKKVFTSSLVSEKVAAGQARIFKLANEGHLKKH